MNISSAPGAAGLDHTGMHEGVRLGAIVGVCTWIWVVIVDAIAGQPFQTLEVIGGIVPGTIGHFILNILYGVVLVGAVRGSERSPSLIIAVIFGLVMMEVAFAMLAVMLGQSGLGQRTWLSVFGGSLIGLGAAYAILSRRYPIAERLHQAEVER